jgi:O-antigen ligase
MPFRKVIILSIVFLYSIYAFFYATNIPSLGYKVMLTLSLLAFLTLFPAKRPIFPKQAQVLYLCFLGLSSVSVFLPFSEHADVDLLIRATTMLLLSGVIVASFANYDDRDATFFKRGLLVCLLTFVSVVGLHQLGVPVKEIFPEFAGFKIVLQEWNEKYYSFWLVFIMWGTISFLWRRNTLDTFIAIGILVVTAVVIFAGYSDSAQIAFIFGVIVFVLMHIQYKMWPVLWRSLTYLYIFAFPLIWIVLPSRWLDVLKSIGLNNVGFRVTLYSFSASNIQKQWLGGYGFGSAPSVLAPFPFETGGHPHNIILFFWLELGILGACLLALVITALFSYIHNATRDRENAPAVWALFGSGLVIFSFSFDTWLPDVVLTYCMWIAMIMLACQNTTAPHPLESEME